MADSTSDPQHNAAGPAPTPDAGEHIATKRRARPIRHLCSVCGREVPARESVRLDPTATTGKTIALQQPGRDSEVATAIDRGRRHLLDGQNPDGSWPETTRPPNLESYAQRISTTAWSLLALLESNR